MNDSEVDPVARKKTDEFFFRREILIFKIPKIVIFENAVRFFPKKKRTGPARE